MEDVFGKALLDYQNERYSEDIYTYSSLDEKDVMPLPYLFRGFEAMPPVEKKALALCKGEVLDIGCGAGSHSLYLQQKGIAVTALDSSAGAIKTCKLRGIKNTLHTDIATFEDKKFDTLLLLMNGIGIVGNLKLLDQFLSHLKSLLKPGGQILLDSSDIIYMFADDEDPENQENWKIDPENYYGEVLFTMKYKGVKSNSFYWLYLDFDTLESAANANNLACDLIFKGNHYNYLARLATKIGK
ncbi:class I SAM-dependent methyltransferase [uncultured Kriegella sp.]|uniref:class I SAM-dependent methyltransferase n=1 Tax=uncultured Kriegella sp. TaxID=1798910 RepID=UPI0030D77D1A|tara:strand:+ start:6455 stop:7180 length:726 start_codon:yes stop_codon:yes gene_type:complete